MFLNTSILFYALCIEIPDFYEKKKKTVQAEGTARAEAQRQGRSPTGNGEMEPGVEMLGVSPGRQGCMWQKTGRQDGHVSTCTSGGSAQNTGRNEMDVGGPEQRDNLKSLPRSK